MGSATQDLCSEITRDVLVEHAVRSRESARRELLARSTTEAEKKIRFYNRFVRKMQKIPGYATCESVNVPLITRLNAIFTRAVMANRGLDA